PGMPDVASRKPTRIYVAGEYLLLLVENVGPIRARGSLRFRYVLAACDRRRKVPVCFVTLENSSSISNVLCVFEADGSHSNYGAVQDCNGLKKFMNRGMQLISDRFDLRDIEEVSPHRHPHGPWWKFRRRSVAEPRAADGGNRLVA